MGKILLALFIVLALLLCLPLCDSQNPVFRQNFNILSFDASAQATALSIPDTAVYYLYCQSATVGEIIQNGKSVIVRCDKTNLSRAIESAQNLYGVSVTFDGQREISALLNYFQLQVTSFEGAENCGYYSILGYTEKLPQYILVDGEKVNLQIVCSQNLLHIGTPLILGSF